MKKIIALILALAMLPCIAFAEKIDFAAYEPADILTFDRDSSLLDWTGQWTLASAYLGATFAQENGIDAAGWLAVPENAATLEIDTILDASANDKNLGTMVDMAAYIHDHVYDLSGTLTIAPAIAADAVYTVKSAWDEWPNNVMTTSEGAYDGVFSHGPTKVHVKGGEDGQCFTELTGAEIEDIESMKYIGMSTAGYMILCYAEDNVAKNDDGEIAYAFVFERVTE